MTESGGGGGGGGMSWQMEPVLLCTCCLHVRAWGIWSLGTQGLRVLLVASLHWNFLWLGRGGGGGS